MNEMAPVEEQNKQELIASQEALMKHMVTNEGIYSGNIAPNSPFNMKVLHDLLNFLPETQTYRKLETLGHCITKIYEQWTQQVIDMEQMEMVQQSFAETLANFEQLAKLQKAKGIFSLDAREDIKKATKLVEIDFEKELKNPISKELGNDWTKRGN